MKVFRYIALIAVAATVVALPAPATAATVRQFEGTVVSVDRDSRTFRLRDSERGTVRIKVTSRTRFERIAGFRGLRRGMTRVEATVVRSNGRWVARVVEISGGGGRHGGGAGTTVSRPRGSASSAAGTPPPSGLRAIGSSLAGAGAGWVSGLSMSSPWPGPVTASLSYTQTREGNYEDLQVRIVRDGVVALDAPVVSPDCQYGCWPAGPLLETRSSVNVVDLDGDGEPEVMVDLYSGGAHCCLVTQIFSSQGGIIPSYSRDEHNFLDPGYTLRDLNGDGLPEFQSADGRLAYAVSSYAGSGLPVQIWRFQNGELTDVTREFTDLVEADSRHWWKRYRKYAPKRPPFNDAGLGALAAWAADEYRLGHGRRVQAELKRALRRGWLDGLFGSGRRTMRNLNILLRQTGYR